jgi:hypothetical protein
MCEVAHAKIPAASVSPYFGELAGTTTSFLSIASKNSNFISNEKVGW